MIYKEMLMAYGFNEEEIKEYADKLDVIYKWLTEVKFTNEAGDELIKSLIVNESGIWVIRTSLDTSCFSIEYSVEKGTKNAIKYRIEKIHDQIDETLKENDER